MSSTVMLGKMLFGILTITKQIFFVSSFILVIWMIFPYITKKEIQDDKPLHIKVVIFVLCMMGAILIELFVK